MLLESIELVLFTFSIVNRPRNGYETAVNIERVFTDSFNMFTVEGFSETSPFMH